MSFILRSGPQEIEILRRDEVLEFHDGTQALAYLRQFLDDPLNRATLRRSLAEGGLQVGAARFDDEDLLVVLAHRIVSGELRVVTRRRDQPPPRPTATATATPREVEAATPQPATPSSAAPAQPGEEEDPLVSQVDPVVQAAALAAAAESGAPVCET